MAQQPEPAGPHPDDGAIAPVDQPSPTLRGTPAPGRSEPSGAPKPWSAPAWLSPDAPAPGPSAAPPARDVSAATAAAIDDVALRMQRIKASARVVRDAVRQREPQPAATVEPAAPPVLTPEPVPPPNAAASPAPSPALAQSPTAVAASRSASLAEPYPATSGEFETGDPSEAAMSGFDELDDDSMIGGEDDDDDFDDSLTGGSMSSMGSMTAPRPVPWVPIAIGAGVVILAAGILFRDQLFGSGPAPAEVTQEQTPEEVRSGSVAPPTPPPAKAPPSPTPPTPPTAGAGQPVAPEGVPAGDPLAPPDGKAPPADAKAVAPVAPAAPAAPAAPLDADALAQLDSARKLYQRQKLKQAAELLTEILGRAPTQPDALLLMAQVQLEQGDFEGSLSSAQKCVAVSSELADCWLTLGVLNHESFKQSKAPDLKTKAVEAYEKYLALAPDGTYARDAKTQLKRLR